MANLTDLKPFDMTGLRPLFESPAVDESKPANAKVRLDGCRTLTTTESRRITARLKQTRHATEALPALPKPGESVHMVLDGSFSLFSFIEVVLEQSQQRIDKLSIVTLSFGARNIARLAELVDGGKVGTIEIICSHYFSAAEPEIYEQAAQFCQRHGFRLAALRSHSKILLLAIADGRRITVESSANLRSCFNIENACIFADPALYDFHAAWIDDVLKRAST